MGLEAVSVIQGATAKLLMWTSVAHNLEKNVWRIIFKKDGDWNNLL